MKKVSQIRQNFLNARGQAHGYLRIGNVAFKLQDVNRGEKLRCFFNALGLDSNTPMGLLLSTPNDRILRWMIANEITSAARNPEHLNEAVRRAVDFDIFEDQMAAIDSLEIERGLFQPGPFLKWPMLMTRLLVVCVPAR